MSEKTRVERGKSAIPLVKMAHENTDPTPVKTPGAPLPTPGPVQTPHEPTIPPETPGAPIQIPDPAPSGVNVSSALVEHLMGALIAQRQTAASDESTFEITNVGGCAVAFPVTDARNGAVRTISLDRRGASAKITRDQVLDVKQTYPHFFDDGHLSATSVVEDGPNTIHSMADFVAAIPADNVSAHIERLTSTSALYDLYNFIENQRFLHEDEDGRAFVEKGSDGKDMLVIHEVDIPPKLLAVEIAVQRRLAALAGVRVALDA